jgi:hypothetical protein
MRCRRPLASLWPGRYAEPIPHKTVIGVWKPRVEYTVSLVGRFRKAAVDSGWLGGTANPRVEVHARRVFRFALMRRPGRLMKLLASPAVRAYSNYVWPLRYRALADNNKILFIRISDIVYIWDDKEWKYLFSPGAIVSGYADLEAFSNYCRRDEKNKSIQHHFKEGVPWHQTELFDVFYRSRFQRERGLTIRGCRNMAELHDLYKAKYDTLFREVEKNGIDYTGYGRGIAPLYVHISKHGEFIWTSDGQHRLAMCMALGLEEIPCRVYARHREWQRRRDALNEEIAAITITRSSAEWVDALNEAGAFMDAEDAERDEAALWFFENFDHWRDWIDGDVLERVEQALRDAGVDV